MAEVVLVHDEGGDWIAMYVNGYLKDEGHSLSEDRVLEILVGETVESLNNFSLDFQEIGKGYQTLDEYGDTLRRW